MGESLQQKERIQSAFGRYVSNYVLNQLLESSDDELHGTEREVTILFCDIRQFTRLSEGMKAADVVALLNEVFQLATDCILEQEGTSALEPVTSTTQRRHELNGLSVSRKHMVGTSTSSDLQTSRIVASACAATVDPLRVISTTLGSGSADSITSHRRSTRFE